MRDTQWAFVDKDGALCSGPYTVPPTRDPDPGLSISLLMFVGVASHIYSFPSFLTYNHVSAYGEANRDIDGFLLAISGKKLEDVLNVRDRFLKRLGINHNLNLTFSFPPLPDNIEATLERAKYLLSEVVKLIRWVFRKEEK